MRGTGGRNCGGGVVGGFRCEVVNADLRGGRYRILCVYTVYRSTLAGTVFLSGGG